MGKRKAAFDTRQLELGLGVPEPATTDGALAGFARQTASAVALILKGDPRNRYEVAAAVSAIVDEDVSKLMLDAYASEARDGHRISFDRMVALAVVTQRLDVLRGLLRSIGCDLLIGEEVYLAEIGHLEAQKRATDARLRALKSVVEPRKGAARK